MAVVLAVVVVAAVVAVDDLAGDPVRAVELVVAAGGAAVMAHPFASARGRVVQDAVVEPGQGVSQA